jgi:hypothetical protein
VSAFYVVQVATWIILIKERQKIEEFDGNFRLVAMTQDEEE